MNSPVTVRTGLSSDEAHQRLARYGPNRLPEEPGPSLVRLLLDQLRQPLMLLLTGAAAASLLLGAAGDAAAMGLIVLVNVLAGARQEHRARRAVRAMRQLTARRATVRRDGAVRAIPAEEIVPGDLLLLAAGDVVAADGQLLSASALELNEALLTGESAPVEKTPATAATTDRSNQRPLHRPEAEETTAEETTLTARDRVFAGTAVAAGTGEAIVSSTGGATELGRVSGLLATASHGPTPLEQRLAAVSRLLARTALLLVLLVASLEWLRGAHWQELLVRSVALAVAAVPEGLAAVVTVALSLGVRRLAACNVLVRRLVAVESLGCVTVICTDKTGTLTTGVMSVRETWTSHPRRLWTAAVACCDASLGERGAPDHGDGTELALLRAAAREGITQQSVARRHERLHTRPFDVERRRMSVLHVDHLLTVKGAAESVLPLCRTHAAPVGDDRAPAEVAEALARRGLRVLAIAVGEGDAAESNGQLELVGLVGLADPPRPEAATALRQAREAGVRTVMITGDHPATAQQIARELGMLADDPMSEDDRSPTDRTIHARAAPAHKLALVRALKASGEVVAMTGDGANDAPALREAHVGVAMGRGGTEVTREAADLVLADDNYAGLVAGVREGRVIYRNLQKTLVYLLGGNAGELLAMLLAAAVGLPPPLRPLHLLWVNLATETIPALALVSDTVSEDVLREPPRHPAAPLLGRRELAQVLLGGLAEATVTLGAFAWGLRRGGLPEAQGLAFSALVLSELIRALAARSDRHPAWSRALPVNRRLLALVLAGVALQLLLHALPATRALLALPALTPALLLGLLTASCLPWLVRESLKLLPRGQD